MQTITQIDIVRDKNFYFYNRRENGRPVIEAQRISADRAKEIVAANAGHVKIQTGTVRFDSGSYEFSWTAEVVL